MLHTLWKFQKFLLLSKKFVNPEILIVLKIPFSVATTEERDSAGRLLHVTVRTISEGSAGQEHYTDILRKCS